MKHFVALFLSLWLMTSLTSCTSSDETSKRIEYTQIIEKRAPQDILNDLYVASNGDTESLARILQITPSSIERIRKGETNATVGFEEKLKEVAIYYNIHGQSFSKLQSALDGEYSWYDSILNFPSHHPFWFWGINIVLILILAFVFLIAIWPIFSRVADIPRCMAMFSYILSFKHGRQIY